VEDFLLLGQIPGTNLVITFWQWAMIFSLLLAVVLCRIELRRYLQNKRQATQVTKKAKVKKTDPTVLDQAAL
jgi:hypothetical protein